jgi:hypothetical protein
MDTDRFVAAIRRFTDPDRRTVLGTALGGSLAGLLGLADVSAKKKRKKKKKKCKGGTIKCSGKCVNLQNNALHCGGCGQNCGANRACVDGACQAGCPSDQIECGSLCVDPDDNDDHCGGCDQPCAAGATCVNGECQTTGTCDPACASDRSCYQGDCTCTSHGQCQRDKDPNGEWCVTQTEDPGIVLCGCQPNHQVCALGESCSFCCTTEFCLQILPGTVCPSVPANSYRGKTCCVPNDSPCDGHDDCCSNNCNLAQETCQCAPAGQPCSYNTGCCSGTCSAITGKCA